MGRQHVRIPRGRRQVECVGGRVGAEGHQPDVAQQGTGDADMVGAANLRGADERLGRDDTDHSGQFVAAILNRRGADDRADFRRGEIERDELADVGKLDQQHIVLADPRRDERARQAVDLARKLGIGQPSRFAE